MLEPIEFSPPPERTILQIVDIIEQHQWAKLCAHQLGALQQTGSIPPVSQMHVAGHVIDNVPTRVVDKVIEELNAIKAEQESILAQYNIVETLTPEPAPEPDPEPVEPPAEPVPGGFDT